MYIDIDKRCEDVENNKIVAVVRFHPAKKKLFAILVPEIS